MTDDARYPYVPGVKEYTTSQEAADAIEIRSATLRMSALIALWRTPMTADETARVLGEDRLAVRPRISELIAMHLIMPTGYRRKNISGRNAHVWQCNVKGMKSMHSVTTRRNFTWSYSSLRNFETCPHRYWHYDILHDVDEPESLPLVEGKRVHDAFRAHVAEGVSLPTGLTMFAPVLGKLAAAKGEVATEQKLALTEALKPTAFFGPGVWFRTVLDYLNVRDNTSLVIDYKTGKPRDGEDLQLELAACVVFAYQPAIEKVKAGFLYTQTEQVVQYEYTRSDAMRIWEKVLPRVNRMLQAQIDNDYQPRPGFLCRKWCAVTSCKYHGV